MRHGGGGVSLKGVAGAAGGRLGPIGEGGGFGDTLHSRHTYAVVFHMEIILGAVVFLLVVLTLAFGLLWSARKKRRGTEAWHKHEHHLSEGIYTAVVAGLAAWLIYTSFGANTAPRHWPTPKVRVLVTAFQWCWRFTYQGTGVAVSATCFDGHVPTLELPTGTPIEMGIVSADVVHEWWVPYLRFKMEAFPDHINTWEMELHSTGTWPGRCAEFCGLYHDAMHFKLKSVAPATFTTWLHHEEALARHPSITNEGQVP